jgi:hypothetical protein
VPSPLFRKQWCAGSPAPEHQLQAHDEAEHRQQAHAARLTSPPAPPRPKFGPSRCQRAKPAGTDNAPKPEAVGVAQNVAGLADAVEGADAAVDSTVQEEGAIYSMPLCPEVDVRDREEKSAAAPIWRRGGGESGFGTWTT